MKNEGCQIKWPLEKANLPGVEMRLKTKRPSCDGSAKEKKVILSDKKEIAYDHICVVQRVEWSYR